MPVTNYYTVNGEIIGESGNRVIAEHDPTWHGEVGAIRDACRKLGTVNLQGCELYTSCEPCAMCVAAMHIAGIAKLYYAASLAQSGKAFEGVTVAARHPIDVEALRAEAGATLAQRSLPAEQKMDREAVEVLSEWAATRRGS